MIPISSFTFSFIHSPIFYHLLFKHKSTVLLNGLIHHCHFSNIAIIPCNTDISMALTYDSYGSMEKRKFQNILSSHVYWAISKTSDCFENF